jgi:FAD synthase
MSIKISGKVVEGKRKGRELGFPTANIELKDKAESGVYAGKVITRELNTRECRANEKRIGANNKLGANEYKAGIFVSPDGKLLEAHLVGFSEDLYGKEIEVELVKKIRDVMKFESDEELKDQIKKDIESICSRG